VTAATSSSCGAPLGAVTTATVESLNSDQLNNAATIINVGKQLNITQRGQVIAIATALQESQLQNLDHGDGTSVGLFQQIDTWGTFDQRHDPTWAATHFYQALLKFAPDYDNPNKALTVSAQQTQRSAFPDAYAKWETLAYQVVDKVSGSITPVDGQTDPCLMSDAYNGPAGAWVSPLDNFKLTSPFGQRGTEMHKGVDLASTIDTPVRAVSAGKVLEALQTDGQYGDGSGLGGYGKAITIDHGNGIVSLYAHNDKVLVQPGQEVKAGDVIALLGSSGESTGPHVHFEIRKDGNAIDPQPFLKERGVDLGALSK
jgi:murein DD-endopeptidase MepM/ murein hydrolase activator NlpD